MSISSDVRNVRDRFLQEDGTQRLLLVCTIVVVVTVFARLPFVLSPGMSTDSYAYLQGWPTLEQLASQGRFGQYLVFQLLGGLAVDPLAFATVLQGAGIASFAFCSPLLFSAFASAEQNRVVPLCLAALFVTLHPYSAEILTFSEASFTALLASATGISAAFLTSRHPRWWWLAGLLLVAALSMYQLLVNYIGLMVLFGFLQTYLRVGTVGRPAWKEYTPLLRVVMVTAGAVVAYLLLHKVVVTVLAITEVGRASVLPLNRLGARFNEFWSLGGFLWERPLLVTYGAASKLLLWGMAGGGWVVLVMRLLRRPGLAMSAPVIAVLLIPLASIGVVAVGTVWWPAPRVLGGVVVAWAMGVYWLAWFLNGRLGRLLVAGTGCALLLGFIAVGHRVHSDQLQLNAMDRLLAQRVYAELITLEGFNDQSPIVVVNRRLSWAHPLTLATAWMDLNLTAFADKRAIGGLLQMSNGRTLNVVPATSADYEQCGTQSAWPDRDFATIRAAGDVLVCL
ncbi:glucosyltransferase domain-containing protein [Stenotrophomonas sp.]|uniref:glucosyltransferase domain-containing protein n=1 Tax=Stenotrophomonas sp. TaxID=69392 RepID=UPI0028AEE8EE|nr:glucosyltransferase domain-containing protein [Stenotrophomonas sp.]